MPRARTSEESRLLRRLERRGDCWIWTGTTINDGLYGQIRRADRRIVRTHRLAYELWVGPIPDGLVIDHVRARGCTSGLCCNPAHLEPVTQLENVRRSRGNHTKTHCPSGHPYDEANTSYRTNHATGRASRQCKTCRREQQRARYHADDVWREYRLAWTRAWKARQLARESD